MPEFVHLHTHSHYSLLDGAGKADALLARAKKLGMRSLALTDHGAMYGIIDFYEQAHKKEMQPILGLETYIAARGMDDKEPRLDAKSAHLILLAESYQGYLNLIKITSAGYLRGFYYKPRVDKAFLKEHCEGLIALSGCLAGEIPRRLQTSYEDGQKALNEYLEIFDRDHFYLEIQHHPKSETQTATNPLLIQLARENKVGLVATNDIHYILPEDTEAQDALMCVSSGKIVSDPNRMNYRDFDLSMTSPEQMAEYFKDTPDALENTVKIAERCQVEIPMGANILPVFPLPKGTTDRAYLRKLCEKGIKERYNFTYSCLDNRKDGELLASPLNDPAIPQKQRVQDRLEYELSVIEKMGFESYFLIVQDFINWGHDRRILIGLRGSAAGSLVSFLIGISDVDPLKHNLIFERFLNPERINMPDIDTDIEDSRRDEVIQYTRERYGVDHVAQIITFGTMAARNAIRDIGRVLAVPYNECDYLAKLIPAGPGGMNLKEAVVNIPEIKALYQQNDQIKHLIDIASRLEGVARHSSVHAAGVVISKEPLTNYVPLQRAAKDENTIVTQYAMSEIEHIGLLKMDFLGLANLSIIQQALRVIRKTRQTEIDLKKIPEDDASTFELLSRAETTGVFQLESSGMKRYLKELKPTQFEDIVSMVALYRPGPMDAIPDFIEAKHGRKKITYLHPILKPILEFTYGVIVTQDQVLEVARKFAGFSYGQADILRKAVGKKIKSLLDEQRDKFINGAVANPEISKVVAEKVWDFVEPFARYGFNRAHAVSYALIAYQTAYLKAHYPVEFMSSLLTSDINNLDRVGIEISECKEMGIEVLPPDVNESFVEFGAIFYKDKVETRRFDAYVRFGLGAVKNVGQHPAEAIVEERKSGAYTSLENFLTRNSATLNKKVMENLAMAGALDSLSERQIILENLETILNFLSRYNKQKNSPQQNLFGETAEDESLKLRLNPCPATAAKQRLIWERELLGIYVSEHPITHYLQQLPKDRQKISDIADLPDNSNVKICGIVMTVRKILTKNGQNMAFVGLEDETSQLEGIFFPKVWADKEKLVVPGAALVVEGKISRKDARGESGGTEMKVLVNSCGAISDGSVASPTDDLYYDMEPAGHDYRVEVKPAELPNNPISLEITVPEHGDKFMLMNIKSILEAHPGEVSVTLLLPCLEGHQPMKIANKVKVDSNLISQLGEIVGLAGVVAT